MIGVDPIGLSNHRGLYLYLDKSDAVYKKGEILTGTASLDLQDSLEIIGEYSYSDEFGKFVKLLIYTKDLKGNMGSIGFIM